jgi:hypothetical protein
MHFQLKGEHIHRALMANVELSGVGRGSAQVRFQNETGLPIVRRSIEDGLGIFGVDDGDFATLLFNFFQKAGLFSRNQGS